MPEYIGPYRRAGASRLIGELPTEQDATDPSRTLWAAWDTLAEVPQKAPAMSGLEFMLAIYRGELPSPPIHHVLGITGELAEPGHVVFSMVPGEMHYNPMGVMHGGVISLILDSALGCSVLTTLSAGASYTTVDLHVTMTRAVTIASGTLRAEGRAVHTGRRVATAEGRLTDAKGRLVASAVTTCLVSEATG
jgi:uncharacterized protein (TIGR00369 family)